MKFGNHLRLSVRGASHAPAISFTLEGFPSGFRVDRAKLAAFMERRAPGRDKLSTARRENDEVEFAAGLDGDVTTGAPVVGRIANRDMRPADYAANRQIPRPGHADFPQWVEAGAIPTGGGANSGRLTAALCAAGGLCLQWLEQRGVRIAAALDSVGGKPDGFEETILAAKADGDSVGSTVRCEATGLPAGIGGALFSGVETELAGALFAIPGVKGVEFGNGFAAAALRGSENNDPFVLNAEGCVATDGNRHGGLLGGRTTGMPVVFRVAFKPTPTLFRPQRSVDLATMNKAVCASKGRHDPCIARRAVPVVEAVAAFVLADILLAAETASPRICLTLTGTTLEEDLAQFRSQRYFADLVELRLDLLDDANRARAAEFPAMAGVPVVLTFRRRRDGGAYGGDEDTRAEVFRSLLRPGCGFAYVDFEDDFRRDDLSAAARTAGVQIIRSLHDFDGTIFDARSTPPCPSGASPLSEGGKTGESAGASPIRGKAEGEPLSEKRMAVQPPSLIPPPSERGVAAQPPGGVLRAAPNADNGVSPDFSGGIPVIPARCRVLRGDTDEIPKIAFKPRCLADVSRLFAETADFTDIPHILCAMGPMGVATRALAVRTHSLLTYASVGGLEGIGHVSPHDLVRTYRIRTITPEATLYGVTGWPLAFTRSPELNNAAFAAADEDAVMVPFPAETAADAVAFMKAIGMRGLAVTYPHKQTIMPLMDALAPSAAAIGAVNTVVREGDRLVGHNTDAAGFAEALKAFLGVDSLADRKVAIVGAGGAARAVAYALRQEGASACVFNRTESKAKVLADEFGFASAPLGPQSADVFAEYADIVVQCASPGKDIAHFDPLSFYEFTGRESVYDLVYEPDVTPTMARARAAGCRAENGLSMLAAQAREQRRLYRLA